MPIVTSLQVQWKRTVWIYSNFSVILLKIQKSDKHKQQWDKSLENSQMETLIYSDISVVHLILIQLHL